MKKWLFQAMVKKIIYKYTNIRMIMTQKYYWDNADCKQFCKLVGMTLEIKKNKCLHTIAVFGHLTCNTNKVDVKLKLHTRFLFFNNWSFRVGYLNPNALYNRRLQDHFAEQNTWRHIKWFLKIKQTNNWNWNQHKCIKWYCMSL